MAKSYKYTLKLDIDDKSALKKVRRIKNSFRNFKIPKMNFKGAKGFTSMGNQLGKINGLLKESALMSGEFAASLGPVSMAVSAVVAGLTGYVTTLGAVGYATYKVLKWGDDLIKNNTLYKTTFQGITEEADRAVESLSKFSQLDTGVIRKELTNITDLMSAVASGNQKLKMELGTKGLKAAIILSKQYNRSLKETTEIISKGLVGATKQLAVLGIKPMMNSKEFRNEVKKLQAQMGLTLKEAKSMTILNEIFKQSTGAINSYSKNLANVTSQIEIFTYNIKQRLQEGALAFTEAFGNSKAGELLVTLMGKISEAFDDINNSIGNKALQGSLEMIYALFKPMGRVINWIKKSIIGMVQATDFKKMADIIGIVSNMMTELGLLFGNIGRLVFDAIVVIIQTMEPMLKVIGTILNVALRGANWLLENIATFIEQLSALRQDIDKLYDSTLKYFSMLGQQKGIMGSTISFFSNWAWRIRDGFDVYMEGVYTITDFLGMTDSTKKIKVKVDTKALKETKSKIKDINNIKIKSDDKLKTGTNMVNSVKYGTAEAIKIASNFMFTDDNVKYNKDTADNTKEIVKLLKGNNTVTATQAVDVFA